MQEAFFYFSHISAKRLVKLERIKYNADIMQYISIFESLTSSKVKDCIANDEGILFVIEENEMGRAIGKGGSNIKRAEGILKKNIRLVEFSNDIARFLQNLIYPVEAKEIKNENGIVIIYCFDMKSKGKIIGRDRHNIKWINGVVKRHFDINEVRVG